MKHKRPLLSLDPQTLLAYHGLNMGWNGKLSNLGTPTVDEIVNQGPGLIEAHQSRPLVRFDPKSPEAVLLDKLNPRVTMMAFNILVFGHYAS